MPVNYLTIPPLTPQDIERFWRKVHKGSPDECWPWQACKLPKGYGMFVLRDGATWTTFYAHRVAWAITHGPIPGDLCVLHHCDNPLCCNPGPGHLFLGTQADNAHDRDRKGRHIPGIACGEHNGTHMCPESRATGKRNGSHTHPEQTPRGEQRPNAKMTAEQVLEIRRRYAAGGITQRALARRYGVTRRSIFSVVHRQTWRHVV